MAYVVGGLDRTARRVSAPVGEIDRTARRVSAPVGGFLDVLLAPLRSTAENVARTVGVPTDAEQMLGRLVENIEVRSAFTPPQYFRVSELLAPGPPSPTTKLVKPMIILSGGSLGRKVIAPGGEVGVDDWKGPAFIGGVAAAVGVFTLLEIVFRIGRHKGKKAAAQVSG